MDSDPNAVFMFKVRTLQEGDKTDVLRSESITTENRQGAKTEQTKYERRFEYLERILQMPVGAALPTKLTRTYHVAQRTDPRTGQLQPLPFNGKTIDIEKRGAGYRFTIDGKPMPRLDALELDAEFQNADRVTIEALLPDHGVKVGESWTVPPAILKAFGGEVSRGVDLARSRLTARLARAYTKEGRQWGSIAFDFELVPRAASAKPARDGERTLKVAGTFDVVIDGSAPDNVMKGTITSEVSGKKQGIDVKTSINGTVERSVLIAK